MNPSPLQSLFQHASELSPEDQDSYLESATDDAGLRKRVLELLESARRSPAFLGSPTLDSQGNAVPDSPSVALSPGSRIGPYELIRRLGAGGGGIVFLARQERPLEREVSLKIMRTSLDDDEPRWRFEVERQAIARMEHPGIARVLDAGLTDEDRPWIVMEYIDGEAITSWCDLHRSSLEERAALMAGVCDAVHHAHQKGVLHRDLKPSNVLVSRAADGSSRSCLIDFGIARLNDVDAQQTRPGHFPGTPAYMSPEQISGSPDAVDARTDIFSLGVILYELLTGASPFREPNSASREVISPDRKTRLAPEHDISMLAGLRGQSPHAWKSALRGDLALIAMKCLRADPAERYSSADALASDLRAFVARLPVSAHRPTLPYLASRLVRRHPLATASTFASVLILIAAGLTILEARRQAIKEREVARAERARAEDLFTGFARLIVAGNPEYGKPQDYSLRQAVMDFAERLPNELTRDARTEARARHTLAHALQGIGESMKARQQFALCLALLEKMPEEKTAGLLPQVLFGNAVCISETNPELAREQLIRAEALLRDSTNREEIGMRVRVLCHLSVLAHDRGDFSTAGSVAERALEIAENTRTGDPELLVKCLWTLARVERSMHRMDKARALQARRLEVLQSALGDDSPQTWDARAELALLDIGAGDPAPQLATLTEMARRTETHFGPLHAQSLARWIDCARASAAIGKHDAAIRLYRETIAKASALSFAEPATLARWRGECELLENRP